MIVLMRGVQDPEEREEQVKRAYTEHHLSVILLLREREQAQILAAAGRSDITTTDITMWLMTSLVRH